MGQAVLIQVIEVLFDQCIVVRAIATVGHHRQVLAKDMGMGIDAGDGGQIGVGHEANPGRLLWQLKRCVFIQTCSHIYEYMTISSVDRLCQSSPGW
ncbi:hypothetical protein D3C76_1379990 [compost metagenome]